MSGKRFVVVDFETLKDTKTGEEFEWTLFVAFFNELAEENEQLRKQLREMKSEQDQDIVKVIDGKLFFKI